MANFAQQWIKKQGMMNTCVKSYRSLMFYDLFGSAVDEIMRNNLGSIYLVANVWLLWPGSG